MTTLARLAMLAFLIPFAACGDGRDRTVNDTVESAAEEVEETGQEVRSEARELGDYTYDRRDDFRRDVRRQLEEIDAEIDELGRDTRGAAGTVSAEARQNIRAARQAVDRNLNRVGDAGEDEWNDIRRGVQESLNHLREAIADVRGSEGPMGGRAAGPS